MDKILPLFGILQIKLEIWSKVWRIARSAPPSEY